MTERLGDGRFGPVYRAVAADGRDCVVRTFTRLDPASRHGLLHALQLLCDAPLDHPSVAKPQTAGTENGIPYLVQDYLVGSPVAESMARDAAPLLPDVMLPITHLAAAIDFAAAVGIHHGLLTPQDIIINDERSGITGFGLAQALLSANVAAPGEGRWSAPARRAGLPPERADDIYALASIVQEWIDPSEGVDADRVQHAFATALAEDPDERYSTALEFAAALQAAIVDAPIVLPAAAEATLLPEITEAADDPRAIDAFRDDDPDVADVPLRTFDEDPAEPRQVQEQTTPPALSFGQQPARSKDSSNKRFAVAAALVIGLLTGFAGGFFAGKQDGDLARRHVATGTQGTSGQATPQPRAADGRDFTEDDVPGEAARAVEARERESTPAPSGTRATSTAAADPETSASTAPSNRTPAVSARTAPGGPAAAAAAATPGRLLVRSTPPGARVDVNGQPRGTTPATVRGLPLGSHTVRVSMPGYDPREERVALSAAGPGRSLDFNLMAPDRATAGALQVDSRPSGAQVYLDGTSVGRTPLVISAVAPGDHTVTLVLPGFRRWSTQVSVGTGARARVAASLER